MRTQRQQSANGDTHPGPCEHQRTQALALLKQAYPGAARPAKLPADPGALSGASAKVMLAAAG